MATPPVNALCIDTDDLAGAFIESGRSIRCDDYQVAAETETVLADLSERGIRSTFFIPGLFVREAPHLVRRIADQGHQVASHGWRHDYVWRFTPREFFQDVSRSRRMLEDLAGRQVDTYKAPIWSITPKCCNWAYDTLLEAGYRIDHSALPAVKRHLGHDGAEARPFLYRDALWVVPMTVASRLGVTVPFGGGFYNAYVPFGLQARVFDGLNASGIPFNFYIHPFEYAPASKNRRLLKFGSPYISLYGLHLGRYRGLLARVLERYRMGSLEVAYAQWIAKPA